MVPVLSAGLGLPLEDTVTLLQAGAADSKINTTGELNTSHRVSGKQALPGNAFFSLVAPSLDVLRSFRLIETAIITSPNTISDHETYEKTSKTGVILMTSDKS